MYSHLCDAVSLFLPLLLLLLLLPVWTFNFGFALRRNVWRQRRWRWRGDSGSCFSLNCRAHSLCLTQSATHSLFALSFYMLLLAIQFFYSLALILPAASARCSAAAFAVFAALSRLPESQKWEHVCVRPSGRAFSLNFPKFYSLPRTQTHIHTWEHTSIDVACFAWCKNRLRFQQQTLSHYLSQIEKQKYIHTNKQTFMHLPSSTKSTCAFSLR